MRNNSDCIFRIFITDNTLSAIIDKVACRKNHLSSLGYEGLCVGQTADKKNWRPDVALVGENGDG